MNKFFYQSWICRFYVVLLIGILFTSFYFLSEVLPTYASSPITSSEEEVHALIAGEISDSLTSSDDAQGALFDHPTVMSDDAVVRTWAKRNVGSFTQEETNNPPNTPSNYSPADDAIDVPLTANLNWIGGDPDGDSVTYDVFLGKVGESIWNTVGLAGFSAGEAQYTSIAINNNGTPYVAFRDVGNDKEITVMKYNGSNWAIVGQTGFSESYVIDIALAIDNNGTPYVAYQDGANNWKATVMKYDGSNWVTVGSAGFSAGTICHTSLVIDNNDIPYVAGMVDDGNGRKATVMKYDGSDWVTVGSAGFSAGIKASPILAINDDGTPYVAFADNRSDEKATVMKYNGNNWETVGSAGFSVDRASSISLAIDNYNTPYVAYGDRGNNDNATVMKYDGSNWVTIGAAGFSTGWIYRSSLAIDDNGTPYVAYRDEGNNRKATVMKYDGSNWVTVGSAGFSNDGASDISTAVDDNGTLYVAYQDEDKGYRATVMSYVASTNICNDINIETCDPGILDQDTQYSWYVVAEDEYGASANSPTWQFTTIANEMPNTPHSPLPADGETGVLESADLSWTGGDPDGNNVTYDVYLSNDGDFTWQTVGPAGFSAGNASDPSLAFNDTGTLYLAYRDYAKNEKATVMKYNGSNWVLVGSEGFSAGKIYFTSLAIDDNGTPYVAYKDYANGEKATVMKYNGISWVIVGSVGFSAAEAFFTSLVIDDSGTPYVAYQDRGNSNNATVMKFNGSNWVPVGSVGFSAGDAYYISLAIDDNDVLYVAYSDYANSGKATVMKYNGNSWVIVGSEGFSVGGIGSASLAIDNVGTPYVAYRDYGSGGKATVMKYNGSNWITVGSEGFSGYNVSDPSINIDDNGTPYVVYRDYGNDDKATMMKYNGSNWVTVGSAGFSSDRIYYTSLVIDDHGIPYVANMGDGNTKATVMKFVAGSIICDDASAVSCDPGVLDLGTQYHWYVAAKDEHEATNIGPIWQFTTVASEIDVQGNMISILDGDTSPDPSDDTDFGGAMVSSGTVTHTFTIENTGDADLAVILPLSITGTNADDFTITKSPDVSIAPSGSTTFSVAFDPSAEGMREATINIDSNDSDESPYDFAVQGNGTDTPWTNLSFDPAGGEVSQNQTLTVDVIVADVVDFYGAQLELTFDPTKLQVLDDDSETIGVQITPGICPSPDNVVQNIVNNSTGTINYSAHSVSPSKPCDGNGIVVSITFKGISEGSSPLDFVSTVLSNTSGDALDRNISDGSLDVVASATCTFSGVTDLQGRPDDSEVTFTVVGGSAGIFTTTTDTSGHFELAVPGGSYDLTVGMVRYLDSERIDENCPAGETIQLSTVTLLGGDAIEDCLINIQDLAFMGARFMMSDGDANFDAKADINADGTVNILDLTVAGANFSEVCPVAWP